VIPLPRFVREQAALVGDAGAGQADDEVPQVRMTLVVEPPHGFARDC
jgi:hypothetical protein